MKECRDTRVPRSISKRHRPAGRSVIQPLRHLSARLGPLERRAAYLVHNGINGSAGQKVGRVGVPIAGCAEPPIEAPELASDHVVDGSFIIGHQLFW